jgi:TolB protein
MQEKSGGRLRPLSQFRQPTPWLTLVTATVLAIVAGCSLGDDATEGSGENAFSKVEGWIAFRSGSDIVAIDPSRPKDTFVLAPALDDEPIAWSLDGTKLLLRSRQEERGVSARGLFVLRPDGSRVTLLPANSPSRDAPTWGSFSPDGTEVVYAGSGQSRGPYVIDADGGRPRQLGARCDRVKINGKLVEVCGEPLPEAAAWSPDGSLIAWYDFVEDSDKYGHHAATLSFVKPDGTRLREEVARLPGEGGSNLVWSPDGSRLAFWRNGVIFIVNADGSGLHRITQAGNNRWPAWSPDGSRIAFVHGGTLYTMASDGTDMQKVDGLTPEGAIAWNPLR